MGLLLAIILNFQSFEKIPEIEIKDREITMVLNTYMDSIENINENPLPSYQLNIRIENSASNKVIYVSSATSIGAYKILGIPDKYSKLGNRVVFWFENKTSDLDDKSLNDFKNQFKDYLVDDLKSDGSVDTNLNPSMLNNYSFRGEPYRFILKNKMIVNTKKICQFPGSKFYENGYLYNKDGYLMFSDGVFDICSLDNPSRFDRDNFNPIDYIYSNSMVPLNGKIIAIITVDKSGKVIKADIEDIDNTLTVRQRDQLNKVIVEMPNWNPQTINGKRVCYRIQAKF